MINRYRLRQFRKILHEFNYPVQVLDDAIIKIGGRVDSGIVVLKGVGYGIVPMAFSITRQLENLEFYSLVKPSNRQGEEDLYTYFFKDDKPANFTQIVSDDFPSEGRKWKSTIRRKVSLLVINDLIYMNDIMDFFMIWRSNLKSGGYLVLFNAKQESFPGVVEAVDYFISNTMETVYRNGDMVILKNTRGKV